MTADPSPSFGACGAVLDAVGMPIWIVDASLEVTYVNDFVLSTSGIPEEAWLGEPFDRMLERMYDSIHGNEELLRANEAVRDGRRESTRTEISVVTDGDRYVRSIETKAVEGDTGRNVINIGQDLTHREERDRQLTILDRILRHNLRNEISVMNGNAQIIETRGDEEVAMHAEIIQRAGERLLDTAAKEREIVDILRKRPQPGRVDLSNVVAATVDELRTRYPAAEITVDRPTSAPVRAIDQIDRAIEELVTNAIEHSDREAPTIEVVIEVLEDRVRIEVTDDGPGIPDDEVDVLTGSEIQPLYHGSGLGLWLINWIVEGSNGSLSFAENDPRGSAIEIELPRA